MKHMKRVLLLILLGCLVLPCTSAFAFDLFGGRLHDGKGRIQQTLMMRTHRDARDVQFTSFRTMLRLEGLVDIAETENTSFRLYGFFEYWRDYATHIDSGLKRAIRNEGGGGHGLQEHYASNEEEEIIKELYIDMEFGGAWNIRLGKQIVTWGETSESRVADIINPLDVTNLVGYPDWEDYKVGLWMARIFFTPDDMWADMSFELIVIPYLFEETRVPPGGSGFFLGGAINPLTSKLLHKWRHDKPDDGWDNTEWGFKVRGLVKDFDWTLSVFHTRLDGPPLFNEDKGYGNFVKMLQGYYHDKIFRYPWYTSIAATFSKPMFGGIVSGEFVLNTDRDYQYGTSDIKEKDLFVSALGFDKNFNWAWLAKINKGVSLITNITWYHYKLLDFEHDHTTGEFIKWENGHPESSWDKLSVKLQTSFFDHTLLTGIQGTYDFNGNTDFVARLMYFPGDHWFYELAYQQINEKGNAGHLGNQVIFNVRYEF